MKRKKASGARKRVGRPAGQLSEDTRREILIAARACFVRLGYERATNKSIATAAGVTAAAMYRYFDSKPELYLAVVGDALGERVSRMRAVIEGRDDARRSFEALLQTVAAMNEEQLATTQFLLDVPTEMRRHPELAKRICAQPNEVPMIVNEIVQAGVEANEISPQKAPQVAALFIAALFGLSAFSNSFGREAGKNAIAGFLDLLDNRVFARPPALTDPRRLATERGRPRARPKRHRG